MYAKYINTDPSRMDNMYHMVTKGLELLNKAWLNPSPFEPLTMQYGDIDQWLFTGFLYRFSIITITAFLALSREFRSAIFVYLFASAVLIISRGEFRGIPFIMVSVITIASLVTRERDFDSRTKLIRVNVDSWGKPASRRLIQTWPTQKLRQTGQFTPGIRRPHPAGGSSLHLESV